MYLADSKINAIVHFRLLYSVTLQGGAGAIAPPLNPSLMHHWYMHAVNCY